jgi:hypothetical protein
VVAGAKVQALTMLDMFLHPELVDKAWEYFRNVQTKEVKYQSFLRPEDKPAIWLNEKIMERYRPDEELLLRSVQVRQLPRSAGNQISDGQGRAGEPIGRNHSYLKATIGSTFVARRAGM